MMLGRSQSLYKTTRGSPLLPCLGVSALTLSVRIEFARVFQWGDFTSCADEAEYCADHPTTLMVHCQLTCGTCTATELSCPSTCLAGCFYNGECRSDNSCSVAASAAISMTGAEPAGFVHRIADTQRTALESARVNTFQVSNIIALTILSHILKRDDAALKR